MRFIVESSVRMLDKLLARQQRRKSKNVMNGTDL